MIKKYGISHQGVHWQSQYTQYKRFEVLTQFIKKDIKASTIVDAGCGFGEYYNYLEKNHLKPKEYIGIDIEDEMIKRASQRFNKITFHKKNILEEELPQYDYYICSGAMNILTKEEMFSFITKCFEASLKGFVFNFLKKDSFNYVSANEVITHCKGLCKAIGINDNYLQNDMTIYLTKHHLTN